MDSKAECDQLNLAHVARNKKYKKETETNKLHSANLVQYRFKILEGSPKGIRVTTEERICERDDVMRMVGGSSRCRYL